MPLDISAMSSQKIGPTRHFGITTQKDHRNCERLHGVAAPGRLDENFPQIAAGWCRSRMSLTIVKSKEEGHQHSFPSKATAAVQNNWNSTVPRPKGEPPSYPAKCIRNAYASQTSQMAHERHRTTYCPPFRANPYFSFVLIQ